MRLLDRLKDLWSDEDSLDQIDFVVTIALLVVLAINVTILLLNAKTLSVLGG